MHLHHAVAWRQAFPTIRRPRSRAKGVGDKLFFASVQGERNMARKSSPTPIAFFVKAWVPFNSVDRFHPERRDFLNKHTPLYFEQLPASLACLTPEVSNITVRASKPPRSVYDTLVRTTWLARFGRFVEVSADVEIDVDELRRINAGKKLGAQFLKHCAADTLARGIDTAILLSELAYPSCIYAERGGVYVGRTMYLETRKKSSFFSLRFPEEDDVQWPELRNIDLLIVSKWSKARGIMERELALTRVERALAAYTHVVRLSRRNRGDGLFRAMQGLEAFYCEGIGDLRRQLSEKCRLWLGAWSDRKNIGGHLYDWRSKFLHGAAGVEFATELGSSWEEDRSVAEGMEVAEAFATRLLVATLQRCIVDGTAELEWSYAVKQS